MRKSLLFFFIPLLLYSGLVQAQFSTYTPVSLGPGINIAQLPAASLTTGQVWLIKDGNSTSDCTVGGGTNVRQCVSNGSGWMQYSGGGAGGGAANGTPLVTGDFAASGGWGSTASFSAVSGTGQRWQVTITSSGTGQAANPTITLTYHASTWTTAPITQLFRNGGTGAGVTGFTVSNTTAAATITATGTPISGETYILTGAN